MTSKHAYYNPNPEKHTDATDCVARAYCKAFDISWHQAVLSSTMVALKEGRIFTDSKAIESMLQQLGCIRHKVTVKKGSKRPTPDGLARSREFKNKTLICSVANHIVTVKDGKYYDTWDSGNKGVYWFYEITEDAQKKFPKIQ